MQRRARRFVTVRGVTLGSPTMTVGSLVKLERTGPAFDGEGYYVTRVHHSYDRELGMRTQFEAERGWIGNGGSAP
jgi:phage protein D